ncbi:MAG: dynamin family protein [Peptococcaceae bacterium]|nr:dynamin family protein [Peptococcaceae bacterium]MDH7524911.1 dynamin family protein [Peptococcaceae bacterium]
MLSSNIESAEKLLSKLEELRELCGPGDSPVLIKQIEETIERLKEKKFVLVVVGQFKRGKSTLINALLGQELLPSAVVPLTSIVTEVSFGEREQAVIHFQNGSPVVTEIDDLGNYITEKGNPFNKKKVTKAEVKIKADFLRNGIVLVDTPGIGSTFVHNTDEAYAYLPMADAVVFVLSADPPISQAEREYLHEITKHVRTVFFVLNKIDALDADETEEACSFNKNIVREITGKDVEFYSLSAKRALKAKQKGCAGEYKESGLMSFEERLKEFFYAQKAHESLAAAAKRTAGIIDQLCYHRSLELSTARLSLEKLQEKQRIFLDKLHQINRLKEDNDILLKAETTKLIKIIQEDLENTNAPLIADTKEIIKAHYQRVARLPVLQEYNELNTVAQKNIAEFYDGWRSDEERKIQDIYGKMLQRYTQAVNQAIEEIHSLVRELFEVRIDIDSDIKPIVPSLDFYYKFTEKVELMNLSLLALASLLPKFIVRPSFRKRNLENIEWDVDRTCGRLQADYSERVMKSVQAYTRQLGEQYETVLAAIRSIIERVVKLKEKTEKEQGEHMRKCEADVEKLESIKKQLLR